VKTYISRRIQCFVEQFAGAIQGARGVKNMPNRKPRNLVKRQVYLSVLLVLAVSLAFSTQVEVGPNPGNPSGVYPIVSTGINSGNNNVALNFTVRDGGDTVINGSVDPGDVLYSFEDQGTMFLNQSDSSPKGLNGFNAGEDIFNVTLLHNASAGSFSGEMVGNFSNDTLYADGGNYSNSKFDGRGNRTPELILRDNGSSEGWLDSQDYVVVNGSLNASNFSEEVVFVDADGDGMFDNGTDAIVRNSSNSVNLEDSDEVLRPGEALSYFGGSSYKVAFPDWDNNGIYQSDQAIIKETGNYDGKLEESDELIVRGEANLVEASNTNLSFYPNNTGDAFDYDDEPVYHENPHDMYVNASSDTRLGKVTVSSADDNDPTTVDLGLETMRYMNSSDSTPHTNEIGRELYNITVSNGYPAKGSFWVYELDDTSTADDILNPGTGDQEILVYDLDDGSQISKGETLLYNSDPSNNNVSIEVGEEFGSDIPEVDGNYSVSADLGYMDNGSNRFEPSSDNVSVNISYGSNWVIVNLAPNQYENTLGGSGTFNSTSAKMRFWNASQTNTGTSEFVADGLFVDTDNSTNVTHGDVRIGEWIYNHDAGEVSQDALDRGAALQAFNSGAAAIVDADDSGMYNPADGTLPGGREAIVSNDDANLRLDNYEVESMIREGAAALKNFNDTSPETLYIDADNSGDFGADEVIVSNDGDKPEVLEDSDTVLAAGLAQLEGFNNSELYVENGSEPGFEKGSMEAIIYDNNSDGVLTRGPLDSGDHVIAAGYANLRKFEQPPREENDSGLVFTDRNRDGMFGSGEDILNVTLVTNGSDSKKINGSEIFNFADSTKHNASENYTDGNAIVNDTDGNGVYQDVLESLEVFNTENMNYSHIMGGVIEVFRDEDGNSVFSRSDDQKVVGLTQDSSKTWSANMNQNITSDTTYFLTFNSSEEITYEGVFDMKARLSSIGLAGDESFSNKESSQTQRIDNYPPQLKTAWTGLETGGNNTERDRMKVVFDESGSFLQNINDGEKDFEILAEDIKVYNERLGTNLKRVVLELNTSIQTNRTPRINITGNIADSAGNKVKIGSTTSSQDGVKPNVTRVVYQDENADGRIDELDVFFSENVSYDSFEPGDWAVTDNNISNFQVSAGNVSDSYMLELDASAEDGVTGVKENEPELNFTQQGNTVYDSNRNSLSTVENFTVEDDAGPAITGAETRDPDFDAEVEEISLNLSENISDHDSTINTSAFNLSEGEIISADTVDANDSQLKLEVRDLETSATPEVTMFTGYLYDFHNNTAADNQTFTATEDGARPLLLNAEVSAGLSEADYTIVTMRFSEDVGVSTDSAVNISDKKLEIDDKGFDSLSWVNFSEPLQTGDMPNITAFENVSDGEGNDVALEDSNNVTVNTFRREIVKGWNFVSLPLAGEITVDIDDVFNNSKIDVIWTRRDGGWETYDSDLQAEGNDFEEFEGGIGYLVKAKGNFTWAVNVETPINLTESDDGVGSTPTPVTNVEQGWSLLGHYQEYNLPANQSEGVSPPGAFASFSDGALGRVHAQSIQGSLEGSLDTVQITDVSGENEDTFISGAWPGHAYWVEVQKDVVYNAVE
jgi:hypothetical protein